MKKIFNIVIMVGVFTSVTLHNSLNKLKVVRNLLTSSYRTSTKVFTLFKAKRFWGNIT